MVKKKLALYLYMVSFILMFVPHLQQEFIGNLPERSIHFFAFYNDVYFSLIPFLLSFPTLVLIIYSCFIKKESHLTKILVSLLSSASLLVAYYTFIDHSGSFYFVAIVLFFFLILIAGFKDKIDNLIVILLLILSVFSLFILLSNFHFQWQTLISMLIFICFILSHALFLHIRARKDG